jgi:hypothetical protein
MRKAKPKARSNCNKTKVKPILNVKQKDELCFYPQKPLSNIFNFLMFSPKKKFLNQSFSELQLVLLNYSIKIDVALSVSMYCDDVTVTANKQV